MGHVAARTSRRRGGLKRGFTFFFHQPGEPFADDGQHARQLLVAASPHDEIGDTHWYRPDFDHALVREAEADGAVYLDETRAGRVDARGRTAARPRRHAPTGGRPHRRRVRRRRQRAARIPRIARCGLTRRRSTGCRRRRRSTRTSKGSSDGIDVAPPDGTPPYPPDDAALHHVFPGGWIWVLRFNNGITSAGAALTDPVAAELRAADGAPAWDRCWRRCRRSAISFGARARSSRSSTLRGWRFAAGEVCGRDWAMLPSAAGSSTRCCRRAFR